MYFFLILEPHLSHGYTLIQTFIVQVFSHNDQKYLASNSFERMVFIAIWYIQASLFTNLYLPFKEKVMQIFW